MGRTLRSVSPRRFRALVTALAGVLPGLPKDGRRLLVEGYGVRAAGGADDVDGVRSARREATSR